MLSQVNENLINNIYNFRPAFNNLFEVFFIKSGEERPLDSEFSKVMIFSCSGVNFNGEDLDIKRHNVTKLFYMDDYKRQDNLKLTFIENKDMRDQRSWLAHLPYKQEVTGSSPVFRTTWWLFIHSFLLVKNIDAYSKNTNFVYYRFKSDSAVLWQIV